MNKINDINSSVLTDENEAMTEDDIIQAQLIEDIIMLELIIQRVSNHTGLNGDNLEEVMSNITHRAMVRLYMGVD